VAQCDTVAIADLKLGESPRLGGIDQRHVRVLARAEEVVEPILVHRATMTVIDGAHRLVAAQLRADSTITVRFFLGSGEDCFAEAVRANVGKGKPLTLMERRKAACRLLEQHPDWSDRALAEICGISPATVCRLRGCASVQISQTRARLGRDGRVRPVDTIAARAAASKLLEETPEKSLREVARQVGASVSTIRDVRARVSRGEAPVALRASRNGSDIQEAPISPIVPSPVTPSVVRFQDDRALSSTEESRCFAAWFDHHFIRAEHWEPFVNDLPLSRLYEIIEEARTRAAAWSQLADYLEERVRRSASTISAT
jgi:hypothetical protein